MKRAVARIAAAAGLVMGVAGLTIASADAHAWYGFGFGYGNAYPAYPNNYYPNYYYPYEYYTPHVPHYYPYYYPYYSTYPGYRSCYTVIHQRIYWKNGRKYVVQVPVRSCYHVSPY